MAIYDAILHSKSYVTILAYAHARSMSSITLQAADCRVLMPDCDVLVHHGEIAFADRAIAVVSNIKYWESHDKKRMLEIYASKCVKGKYFKSRNMDEAAVIKYILKKMSEKTDWILTAKQAVNYGFADGILGTKGYMTIDKIRK